MPFPSTPQMLRLLMITTTLSATTLAINNPPFTPRLETTSDSQCYSLKDPKAPLRGLSQLFPTLDYDGVLFDYRILVSMFPERYTTCAASLPITSALDLAALFRPSGICGRFLAPNGAVTALVSAIPKNPFGFAKFADTIKHIDDETWRTMCATSQHLAPCLEAIEPLVRESDNGCCQEIFPESTSSSSGSDSVMTEVVVSALELVCAERLPTKHVDMEPQMCGYTWAQVLLPGGFFSILKTFHASWHIANEAACDAYNGRSYIGLDRSQSNFTLGTDVENGGTCAISVDRFFSSLKQLPNYTEDYNVALLLGDDSCLPGDHALDFISQHFNPLVKFGFDVLIGKEACVHLPTGFSAECDYN